MEPLLEVLVSKTMEQALMEIEEETELMSIKNHMVIAKSACGSNHSDFKKI